MKRNALTYEDYLKLHPATKKNRNDPIFSDGEKEKPSEKKQTPEKNNKIQTKSMEKSHTISGNPEIDKKVTTYLSKMKKMVDDALASGGKLPNFDLCEVSVPGTNLFCGQNKGIKRQDMPQLKGKPADGSEAEKLTADKDGEVSIEQPFIESLKSKGVGLTNKRVNAAHLKATQNQLVGSKIVGMIEALKKDPNHPKITAPIFVSKDGYVLDGHHRWAAMVGLDFYTDKPVEMNVIEVDMGIDDLVRYTNDFADEIGIRQKAAKLRIIADIIRSL